VSFVGCLLVGAANGAFWTLGPVFAIARSDSMTAISLFITLAVVGGALAQWPLGRLSDRLDRRWIVVCTTTTATVSALALAFAPVSDSGLLALACLFGMGALPVYTLCVAHANDHAAPGAFVDISGQLLLLFGLGAMLGPILGSAAIREFGPGGLFAYIAVGHGALALFALARMRLRAPVPVAARRAFQPLPRTTPQAAELAAPTASPSAAGGAAPPAIVPADPDR
jgi:MFS family permease